MKIEQEKGFKPITIVLKTEKEAMAFWDLMNNDFKKTDEAKKLAIKLANWFSNQAHFGP